ncbi:MAG TPA: hypothetical protein VKG85_02880 [Actinomycetes bacterium]|nr:hypothetical protein [Actinomycetes bacterium]
MISTEHGPDEVLEARIRQALAGERFTVPTATITGRMSRHRRRTWVAAVAAAVAAAATVVPVLSSIRTDPAPVIKPPVILPGPTGTTLDDECQSSGLAELAAADDLRPSERSALPSLRYASDLDGVRVYASHRVVLVCRWSDSESQVQVEVLRTQPGIDRLFGPDLDHLSAVASSHGYVVGGLPPDVVAVEIELSDGTVVPGHVAGDTYVGWWDGSAMSTGVKQVTAIAPDAVYTRSGSTGDSAGSELTTTTDGLGDDCEQAMPYRAQLIAGSQAVRYRIYRAVANQIVLCVPTGSDTAPVSVQPMNPPTTTRGVPIPTLTTVTGADGLGFIMGSGDPTDVELHVGQTRLRPAIRDGFYAAAVPGGFGDDDLTRWVYVSPTTIYTGTGTTETTTTQR